MALCNHFVTNNMSSIDAVISKSAAGASQDRKDREDEDPADGFNALDLREDSEGWNDIEDDAEDMSVKCLLCEDVLSSVRAMAAHCRFSHDFDLTAMIRKHGRWVTLDESSCNN